MCWSSFIIASFKQRTSEWKRVCWARLKNHLGSFVSVRHKNQVCSLWSLKRYNIRNWFCLNSNFEADLKTLMSVLFFWESIRFAQCYLSVNSLYGSCCCHASLSFCLFWVVSCCFWLFSRPNWKLWPHSKTNLLSQHEDEQGTSPTPISCSPVGCFLWRRLGIRQFQTAQSCSVPSLEGVACLWLLNQSLRSTYLIAICCD